MAQNRNNDTKQNTPLADWRIVWVWFDFRARVKRSPTMRPGVDALKKTVIWFPPLGCANYYETFVECLARGGRENNITFAWRGNYFLTETLTNLTSFLLEPTPSLQRPRAEGTNNEEVGRCGPITVCFMRLRGFSFLKPKPRSDKITLKVLKPSCFVFWLCSCHFVWVSGSRHSQSNWNH